MKKIMKSFMAMALGLSLVLSGCSDDDENDLSAFTGNYPVEIDVNLSGTPVFEGGIETTLTLSADGGNFKASANLDVYGKIDIVLSSLNSNISGLVEGSDATGISGYLFKVAEQEINITGMGAVKIKGSDEEGFNGYHGCVAKGSLGGQAVKTISMFLEGVELPVTIEITDNY